MQESTTLNRATDNERYANRLSVQKKKQSLNPLIFISCLSLIELLSLILSFLVRASLVLHHIILKVVLFIADGGRNITYIKKTIVKN